MAIDPRERFADPEEIIRTAVEAGQSKMWTSAPGKIVSFDPAKQTASIQLQVKSFIKQEDGSQKSVDIPVLQDVPVQFPGGGGMVMTFPVKPGDEVLVNFSSRSPDAWQQSGKEGVPPDASMHSLSNGFAQLGYRSNPSAAKVTGGVNTTGAEMRSEDGMTKMSMSASGGVAVTTDKSVAIAAAGGTTMNGNMSITGTLTVTGEIILNGISLSTHRHTGVTPGGGTSTGPIN